MYTAMHHLLLSLFGLLLLLSYCDASPIDGDSSGAQLLRRDAAPAPELSKRACINNGCKCYPVSNPGVYCWGCGYITDVGRTSAYPGTDYRDWAFECNTRGGCCAYGPSSKCNNGDTGTCGAD
ncbi:hypothetical protein BZA05DRAFT_449140 [Tricharina praecox]|uniref:uncharacterized protein n=1 Tax=Tricharina praecox TaxID=43433 RepID=UPI002220B718|nr:uncharacterized protein BZA05DRAFT_449140 [Tricharina praecox]KAI5842358.1 hypothetical protein BZA05DRAFT_449140 [Tricharina praecox]